MLNGHLREVTVEQVVRSVEHADRFLLLTRRCSMLTESERGDLPADPMYSVQTVQSSSALLVR